jgi:hypothetical protein
MPTAPENEPLLSSAAGAQYSHFSATASLTIDPSSAYPDSVYWDSSNVIEFTDSNGDWRIERTLAAGNKWSHATISLDGTLQGTIRPVYAGSTVADLIFEPASVSGGWIEADASDGTIFETSGGLPGDCETPDGEPRLDEGCCSTGGEGFGGGDGPGCEETLSMMSFSLSSMQQFSGGDEDPCQDEFDDTVTELAVTAGLFGIAAKLFSIPEPGITKAIGGAVFAGGIVTGTRALVNGGQYLICVLSN